MADADFREPLIASPAAAWSPVLGDLNLPAHHPLYKIQTLRLFAEFAETIGIVMEFEGIHLPAIEDLSIS